MGRRLRVRMILPALTEAKSPLFRPIKYSLFPPLGLATLAAYLDPEDEVVLSDEHVERLKLDDEPDLVVIQVYITSARRSYELADMYRRRGAHVAIRRLHELGVMVNGSFVFGMDHDGADVFERTVEWAVDQGIETATFHILTPYPDTALHGRMEAEGRILHHDWDLYDTRHVVFRPARLGASQLESGYWRAYRDFYAWRSIIKGASAKSDVRGAVRHVAYAAGWKKFEPLWDAAIRSKQVLHALPLLETILAAGRTSMQGNESAAAAPTRLRSAM